jgi:DNA invertase Pin-like site-specific DNA recombinase
MKKTISSGFLAYYRVSTDKQGVSGLGLDAQRAAVARYVAGKGELLAEYTEIESGKSHLNRPQLKHAIEACKKQHAKLIIAKLDRLARNVHFISGLMESGVEFCAVDMPQANRLTVHIMAAIAEHEREMISARTKAALEQVKARGIKLGNPRWRESIGKATAARHHVPTPEPMLEMIRGLRTQGRTFRQITEQLNGLGLKTGGGSIWYASTVRAALLKSDAESPKIIVMPVPKGFMNQRLASALSSIYQAI